MGKDAMAKLRALGLSMRESFTRWGGAVGTRVGAIEETLLGALFDRVVGYHSSGF